jgi:hypothetical protein
MKILLYATAERPWAYSAACKVQKGFQAHGLNASLRANPGTENCDLAVIWGVRDLEKAKTRAKNVLVMELAYLGDRQHWISLGYNGLNGEADFRNQYVSNDRAEQYWIDQMKPYNFGGDYILLTLQIKGDQSLAGLNVNYQRLVNTIRDHTEKPIHIRDHPKRKNTWPKVYGDNVHYVSADAPIAEAVQNAHAVVTINSNSGVDAIMNGTPVFNVSPKSMVWNIANKEFAQIEAPLLYDRTEWLNRIAYAQWLPNEIESGLAWEHLK